MNPTQGEASGSQQQDSQKKYLSRMFKNLSSKELSRTELQLGLPGSPPNEDFSPAMQLKQGLVSSANTTNTTNNNNSVAHRKNIDDQQQEGGEQLGANVTGFSKRADQVWQRGTGSSSSSSSCHGKQGGEEAHESVDKHEDGASGSQSRAPVGWPPVQSFRKNSLNTPPPSHHHSKDTGGPASPVPAPPAPAPAAPAAAGGSSHHCSSSGSSQFVKVYMDGVPIGRKVNLRTHSSYEKLSMALEEMFRRFICGQSSSNKAMKEKLLSESKKFNFIYGSDYVLTYEDKDGDLMLVGDVPWLMFAGTVKRLRIMKGSEAIGLAPREQATPAK